MKPYALIVDDVEMNRDILRMMVEDKFEVIEAEDGKEALDELEKHADEIAVMLLDLVMPRMDGLDVLSRMKEKGWNNQIPVLIISGETEPALEQRSFDLGAFDFIHKPYNRTLVDSRVDHAVALFDYKRNLEKRVREQTEKLRVINEQIIEMMGSIVEARNLESGTHIRRVKGFTRILAKKVQQMLPRYGLDDLAVERISSASSLHDVGKIMISDSILLKKGKLTPEEFDVMKSHTTLGRDLLKMAPSGWDKEFIRLSDEICHYHHEKWDGRGYPEGLKGDEIPISAQIVSVADCFDALTTRRPYKEPFSVDKAYEMILGGECGAFNEELMQLFVACKPEFSKIVEEKGTENEH